jgi:hypothetical protein
MPSPDHHRIVDAGVGTRKRAGVGAGKRPWYATIFSVERPRSRSISTERRGRSVSRAGSAPRSWSPSCRPMGFTRATSVFTSAVLHINAALFMPARIAFMAYRSSLTGMRRRALFCAIDPALRYEARHPLAGRREGPLSVALDLIQGR